MTTVKKMLETADPLKHESLPTADQRARMRERVLAASSHGSILSRRQRTMPVTLAAALASIGIAVLVASLMWTRGGSTVQAAVRFEVRLAEDQPLPGLTAARIANSNRIVYLHPEILVTNSDIAGSRVVPSSAPAQFWIDVQLSANGAQKMRQATATHLGKPLAILLDGDVVMVPTIKSAIGGSAMITGDYTRAEAERIAAGMNPNQ